MSTCKHCGGLKAEPGKAYGYSGAWCHCVCTPKQHPYVPEITPDELDKMKVKWNSPENLEEMTKHFERQAKGEVKKPSFSHILNLCEQLSLEELKALVGVLSAMHDSAVLSSNPGQFKKETNGLS